MNSADSQHPKFGPGDEALAALPTVYRDDLFAGKVVLVSGAGSGIGKAIAFLFARLGATLAICGRKADKLEDCAEKLRALSGREVITYPMTIRDPEQVDAMLSAVWERFGGVDVLVNNAGVYHAAPLLDTAPEDFDRVMQVNVYGAFHVMQGLLRHMRERGRGKVVNIASTAGKWGSMNQSAYNASKHALVGLTRCAALELGPTGINVNAICPGFVETDMLDSFRAHSAITGQSFEQIMAAGKARVPLRRFLQPAEIAHLAVYLGSAESDGMTGQTLLLDGGMLMV